MQKTFLTKFLILNYPYKMSETHLNTFCIHGLIFTCTKIAKIEPKIAQKDLLFAQIWLTCITTSEKNMPQFYPPYFSYGDSESEVRIEISLTHTKIYTKQVDIYQKKKCFQKTCKKIIPKFSMMYYYARNRLVKVLLKNIDM